MTNILAVTGAVAMDIAFFVILLAGTLLGAWRGFARGICKIAGTIFSIIIAVTFCIAFANILEGWGLTAAIADGVKSSTIGWWLTVAISFVALIIIVRVGAWLLGKLANSVIKKSGPIRTIDRFLGAVLGLAEAFCIFLFLMAVCNWIPSDSLHEFIGSSTVVGAIFNSSWFLDIMANITVF